MIEARRERKCESRPRHRLGGGGVIEGGEFIENVSSRFVPVPWLDNEMDMERRDGAREENTE